MATFNGSAGNDTLLGGFDHDTINGFGGNDTLRGDDGNDTLNGGAGNDKLVGGMENDLLLGDAGNDTLDGAGGSDDDTLKGGVGNDFYLVDSLFDVVEDGVGGGKDTVRATTTYQLSDAQEIESLILDSSGSITGTGNGHGNLITMVGAGQATMYGLTGNDTLKGGGDFDVLYGGEGDDILTGGDGDDTLAGEGGADKMTGGKGNDYYQLSSVADKIAEQAGQGIDNVFSPLVSYTLGANFENLQLGVTALDGTGNGLGNFIVGNVLANKLNGAAGKDSLSGNDGNDTLDGGTGDDTLKGGSGADSLTGGAGNDVYIREDTGDVIAELAGGGIDTVQTYLGAYVLAANVENLTLIGFAFSGTGNGLANVLTGNIVDNVLAGEAGNDTLDGGAGNDTLKGGVGNDLYLVDSSDDVVEDIGGKDTIRATSFYHLSDSQEIESLLLDSDGEIGAIGNSQGNRITMVGAGEAFMRAGTATIL